MDPHSPAPADPVVVHHTYVELAERQEPADPGSRGALLLQRVYSRRVKVEEGGVFEIA